MPVHCKRILLACIIALPSFVFAADTGAETTPTAPKQALESAPAAVSAPQPAVLPQVPTAQAARIGYVDIARIGVESERGKTLKNLLTAKKDALQAKIDLKKKQLDKLRSSIETKIASMTPQQREAKSKEFQKKLEEFQKFAQESENEFYTLQNKETGSLYEAIEQAATAHGAANRFSAIVHKKELLYIGSSVDAQDVTDALITAINLADRKK